MQKLAAKLVKVMHEVAYVAKNGNNEYHGYSYATSADVLQKINAALTKYNICSIASPEVISMTDVTTAKGNTEHLATVKISILLVDAESGETVTIAGLGSGQDIGDKAVMKAETAAIKYSYLLSMAIQTGDDPEADTQTDEAMEEQPNMDTAGKKNVKQTRNTSKATVCADCGVEISEKVRTYSAGKYGRPLCMKCQQQQHNVA
ncbi:MAG: ERF family protein [Veillonellales bacterium]